MTKEEAEACLREIASHSAFEKEIERAYNEYLLTGIIEIDFSKIEGLRA